MAKSNSVSQIIELRMIALDVIESRNSRGARGQWRAGHVKPKGIPLGEIEKEKATREEKQAAREKS